MSDQKQQTLPLGTVIQDKWIILEFIGKGGMGEVYRAHQVNLKRDIAIKIISREWLESMEENEDELKSGLQRFRNEVLAMAQVRHPNILQIYDYGSFSAQKDQAPLEFEYIAMEYVPGGTLRSTMSEEGFYPEEHLTKEWLEKYFLPVLDGVRALHASGIIHRDLKPGNILLDGHTPRIADFGLARSARIGSMTMSTDIKGTPAYMSPEHFMDLKRADHRSDIYSLGKILFEAIDGKIGPGVIPLKSASLREAESPFFEELDQIIRKATAEDRNDRFDSVEEFEAAIVGSFASMGSGKGIGQAVHKVPTFFSRPKWIWAGVATAVILVLAMTMWHLLGEPGKSAFRKAGGSSATLSYVKPPDADPPNEPPVAMDAADPLPDVLTGKDGATLHLIPAGQLPPKEMLGTSGDSTKTEPFYMDETEVTNHQYVEFLNSVLHRIHFEEGVVKGDGSVWLLLGEVVKGYEPIVFQDGGFTIKDPARHSHPVVRVTAKGAAAYAAHYGRRLPTAAEWLYADKTGKDQRQAVPAAKPQQPAPTHMENMHGQSQKPKPSAVKQNRTERPVAVTQFSPNRYGIRGLEGNVDEWGIMPSDNPPQASNGSRYGIFPEGIGRLPWEAFKDVGFRTATAPEEWN